MQYLSASKTNQFSNFARNYVSIYEEETIKFISLYFQAHADSNNIKRHFATSNKKYHFKQKQLFYDRLI